MVLEMKMEGNENGWYLKYDNANGKYLNCKSMTMQMEGTGNANGRKCKWMVLEMKMEGT